MLVKLVELAFSPLLQYLWCSALQLACTVSLAALRPAVARSYSSAPVQRLCGLLVIMVWRSLPVEGKLVKTTRETKDPVARLLFPRTA